MCTFYFLQAVWRWNNNIHKDDRQYLMRHFQKLVFSTSNEEFPTATKFATQFQLKIKKATHIKFEKPSIHKWNMKTKTIFVIPWFAFVSITIVIVILFISILVLILSIIYSFVSLKMAPEVSKHVWKTKKCCVFP